MKDRGKILTKTKESEEIAAELPRTLEDRLLAEYGDDLSADGYSDEQAKACLTALWQLMVSFVDLGFSVKPGDKISPDAALSFDDVLNYICLEDTAPETVASSQNMTDKKEPR